MSIHFLIRWLDDLSRVCVGYLVIRASVFVICGVITFYSHDRDQVDLVVIIVAVVVAFRARFKSNFVHSH